MKFDTQNELIDAFEAAFLTRSSNRWVCMREFDTCAGIADLVGVRLTRRRADNAAIGQIPSKWAYALRALPYDSEFTAEYLSELANVRRSVATSALKKFCASGLCERIPSTKAWRKTIELEPVASQIVAVEAKLRNWRRALYQAVQHLDYASHSWVVLDQSAISAARFHVDEFQSRCVGLAGITSSGQMEVVITAPRRAPRIPYRFWRANSEIAKRLA
jgi:hypothetical protein